MAVSRQLCHLYPALEKLEKRGLADAEFAVGWLMVRGHSLWVSQRNREWVRLSGCKAKVGWPCRAARLIFNRAFLSEKSGGMALARYNTGPQHK